MWDKLLNKTIIIVALIVIAIVVISIWGNDPNPGLIDVLKELVQHAGG